MSSQVSSESSDSVAPAGLGYMATTRPCGVLSKKNAMLIGIIRPSHWPSVIRKSGRERMLPGNALVFRAALAGKQNRARIAGADELPRRRLEQVLMLLAPARRCTARSARPGAAGGRTAAGRRRRCRSALVVARSSMRAALPHRPPSRAVRERPLEAAGGWTPSNISRGTKPGGCFASFDIERRNIGRGLVDGLLDRLLQRLRRAVAIGLNLHPDGAVVHADQTRRRRRPGAPAVSTFSSASLTRSSIPSGCRP